MKTTIDIADPILAQAREVAARRGTTLKALVEEALRQVLAQERRPKKRFRLRTHTFKGNGLQAGLTWGDWDTFRGLAYEGRGG